MQEHDHEPLPGLPQSLPAGEQIIWQGRSDYRSLARGSFHLPKLVAYFVVLLVLRTAFKLGEGGSLADSIAGTLGLATLAAAAIGILLFYARQLARTTLFTLTNRRVVIRSGVTVPVTMNLPYSKIEAANLRRHGDGSADIALVPEPGSRASYVLLWPMVKPWRFLRVQPLLRGLPDGERVAELLADALAAAAADAEELKLRTAVSSESGPGRAHPRGQAAPSPGRRSWNAYPTVPLAAAVSLVLLTLVTVAWNQFAGSDAGDRSSGPVAASIDLKFEDREDGSVVVFDASDDRVIDVLQPGTNGFLRSTLRTFVRARRAIDAGSDLPFSLLRTDNGQLLLRDDATGHEIDLWAFGTTNARSFGRFLENSATPRADVSGQASGTDGEATATAVAMSRGEATQ